MTKAQTDAPLNPRELEQSGGVPGDVGLVDGEPDGGTDHNYSAPPPKMKVEAMNETEAGRLEQRGGDGMAPTEVK